MFGGRDKNGESELDLSSVRYIKRIRIGSVSNGTTTNDSEVENRMALVNRCLNAYPRGKIISVEQTITVITVGGHPMPVQNIAYHIGFSRVPSWLETTDFGFSGAAPPQDGNIKPDPTKVSQLLESVTGNTGGDAPLSQPTPPDSDPSKRK